MANVPSATRTLAIDRHETDSYRHRAFALRSVHTVANIPMDSRLNVWSAGSEIAASPWRARPHVWCRAGKPEPHRRQWTNNVTWSNLLQSKSSSPVRGLRVRGQATRPRRAEAYRETVQHRPAIAAGFGTTRRFHARPDWRSHAGLRSRGRPSTRFSTSTTDRAPLLSRSAGERAPSMCQGSSRARPGPAQPRPSTAPAISPLAFGANTNGSQPHAPPPPSAEPARGVSPPPGRSKRTWRGFFRGARNPGVAPSIPGGGRRRTWGKRSRPTAHPGP